MRTLPSWLGLVGILALAGLPAAAGAQPVGSEFQVNTYTTGSQTMNYAGGRRAVAADPSGKFVVVWASDKQDGSNYGVFAQRYDSGGNRLGAEFRVNSYTTANQANPVVASDAAGNFVVVWNSGGMKDGSQTGVFGQRFGSAGNKLGGEFQVNSYTTGPQSYAAVAFDGSGNFIVVWRSDDQDGDKTGIFGQRYNSSGQRRGTEFQVSTYTTSHQRTRVFGSQFVAPDARGNFVVVWQGSGRTWRCWTV